MRTAGADGATTGRYGTSGDLAGVTRAGLLPAQPRRLRTGGTRLALPLAGRLLQMFDEKVDEDAHA